MKNILGKIFNPVLGAYLIAMCMIQLPYHPVLYFTYEILENKHCYFSLDYLPFVASSSVQQNSPLQNSSPGFQDRVADLQNSPSDFNIKGAIL